MPDSFDRDEEPTRPDLRPEHTKPCPACVNPKTGESTGIEMRLMETATGHSSRRVPCSLCDGLRVVSREVAAAYKSPQRP
jgi:hypothetical protein